MKRISTPNLAEATAVRPARGLLVLAAAIASRVRAGMKARRDRRALAALDRHLQADIGLTSSVLDPRLDWR